MRKIYDFIIIGGGVTGLNISKQLVKQYSPVNVLVIDKDKCGAHASGKCSGVIHAGIYYSQQTLKAQFCREGNKMLSEYCQEFNLPFQNLGKLICMRSENQISMLENLYYNAKKCGSNVQLIDYDQAKEIEPRIKKYSKYLWSPNTSIADPPSIIRQLKKETQQNGIEIKENTQFLEKIYQNDQEIKIKTSQGEFIAKYIVNCSGLYADKIAHQFQMGLDYELLPFRGIYIFSKPEFQGYKTLVYPAVDTSRHSHLGLHTTQYTDGRTSIGPTAIPCLWRQQYQGLEHFSLSELLQILKRFVMCGMSENADLYLQTIAKQFKNYNIKWMLQDVIPMVNDVSYENFNIRGKSCVHPYLVNKKTQELLQDFLIEGDSQSMHVLNVISPGWTCSIPFSKFITQEIHKKLHK